MTLEERLENWAADHFKDCHAAMLKGDATFRKKCLGAIVRKRGAAWVWWAAASFPAELLRLTPYAGRFKDRGYELPPGDLSWSDYIKTLDGLDAAASGRFEQRLAWTATPPEEEPAPAPSKPTATRLELAGLFS